MNWLQIARISRTHQQKSRDRSEAETTRLPSNMKKTPVIIKKTKHNKSIANSCLRRFAK